MPRLSVITALFFLVVFPSLPLAANPIIDESEIRTHIEYLSSSELAGRYPGTEGIFKAEKYIIEKFQSYNINALGNSYVQEFDIPVGLEPGEGSSVYFDVIIPKPGVPIDRVRPMKRTWEPGSDWMPHALCANGNLEGDIIFAGYGITANELKYDDYKDINANGKIAIILSHSPDGSDSKGDFDKFSDINYKIKNAKAHGVSGILYVKIQSDSANVFEPLNFMGKAGGRSDMIILQTNRTSIAQFFPRGMSLLPLEKEINKSKTPKSFEIPNTKIYINVNLTDKIVKGSNIAGIIKGTSKPDEYIIMAAHHDGLGWFDPEDRKLFHKTFILNGADNNSSGVAALIEAGNLLQNNPPEKSVIIISFTGSENAQKGSEYFIYNCPVDKSKIISFINLDMIGKLKDRNISIFGLASANEFNNIINSASDCRGIYYSDSYNGFGGSDETVFCKNKIPSLLLTTGTHDEMNTPTDIAGKINYQGVADIATFTENLIRKLSKADKISFSGNCDFTNSKSGTSIGKNLWTGLLPSNIKTDDGFYIYGSINGSPAKKAGFKDGDKIIKINDKEIENFNEFMEIIRQSGIESVDVTIFRDDTEKILKLKPENI